MSAPDEFDPFIERLYARAPQMPDAAQFAAGVERRLDRGSRFRALFLTLAGLVGGVVAVRETVGSNLVFSASRAADSGVRVVDTSLTSVTTQGQSAVLGGLEQLGLASALDLGAMGGMTLFWGAAAVVMALATLGALKLTGQT
jgi:hypothetical protein